MKRFQSLVTGLSAMALVAAFAAPTMAAKQVIEEDELDEVTAAGQPKIAMAMTQSGSATAVNFQVNVFAAHLDGQSDLSALTLNNIFGENQVANGVNIQSGAGGAGSPQIGGNSGNQSNTAEQSWGSSKAWSAVTTAAVKGKKSTCRDIGIIAKCAAIGGDAKAGSIALLWAFADEIASASTNVTETEEGSNATAANVVVTIIAGGVHKDVNGGGQDNLSALTVNNVFGFNQVANGTNISAGTIGGDGGGIGAGGVVSTGQGNQSDQWRGAPANWNQTKTFY